MLLHAVPSMQTLPSKAPHGGDGNN
jgi:hypothetical protein